MGYHALLQRIILIDPGIESTSPVVPALQADSLPPSLLGSLDAACVTATLELTDASHLLASISAY